MADASVECCHPFSGSQPGDGERLLAEQEEEEEEEEEDAFFTEEAYEMYSLSRRHCIREYATDGSRTINRPRRGRDPSEKAKEKQLQKAAKLQQQQKQPVKGELPTLRVAKQPKQKQKATPAHSLASPYPNLNYPTFSRLTAGQHRKFMALQAKYGSKGTRVTSSQESAELQHWRQLGAMIYQDQQDFNGFAEFAAQQHPEVYLNVPAAAVKYVTDALKANVERVESLPRHYAVLQTFTLNPGVPLPSDPTLQTIGTPVFLGKIPELSVPDLDQQKVTLKRTPITGEPEPVKNDNIVYDHNIQKLAQVHKADIVLSSSSLLTLVNNHAPRYEQQWEIPVEVKAVTSDESSPQRVVYLRKPLMKHVYYPHEASALYHKFLLKRMLTSGLSRDRYSQTSDRSQDDEAEQCRIADAAEECHLEPEEHRVHQLPEEDFGDFGAASILELETFGTEPLAIVPQIEKGSPDTKGSGGGLKSDESSVIKEKPMEVAIIEPVEGGITEPVDPGRGKTDVISGPSESCDAESKDNNAELSKFSETGIEGLFSTGESTREVREETSKIENGSAMCQNDPKPKALSDVGDGKKLPEYPEKKISKVVRMNVRSSKRVSDNDLPKHTDDPMEVCEHAENFKAREGLKNRRPRMVRMRFSSESSDDDTKLTIVTDSDSQISTKKEEPNRGANNAENTMCSNHSEKGHTAPKIDVSVVETKESTLEDKVDSNHSQDAVKDKITEASESPAKRDEEVPPTRMVTRRSARIRQQSSSEEKTGDELCEGLPPQKRLRGRRKGQKQGANQQMEGEGGKDQEKGEKGSTDNVRVAKEDSGEECKLSSKEGIAATGAEDSISRRTRRCKKELAVSGSPSKVSNQSPSNTAALKPDAEPAKNVEQGIVSKHVEDQKSSISSPDNDQPSPTENKSRPLSKRQLRRSALSDTRTPGRPAKKTLASAYEPQSRAASTIDEIMRLQEKMLTRQKANPAEKASVPPAENISGRGQTVDGQMRTDGDHPQATAGLTQDSLQLEEVEEGNYACSLWKFGRLRLLLRSKSHGLLGQGPEGPATVASVVAKMEPQAGLGLTVQTPSDLTKMWLDLYLRPGSKVIRGRINSRTSEIISWECVDSSWLVQSQQLFNPAMCMKMLYHVLLKLGALPEGRYLLRHRPGDAHVCIYQCMEQAGRSVRASYDLHAAHRAAKLMTSLPPTMPWVPLDPNAPYPSKRWQGCAPITFPPCPPNFKHPSLQHQHRHPQGGRNKRRKKKK